MGVPDVEILLPVHNEGESIEATIREIYNEFSPRTNVGFIICEDGSKDNTKEALRRLANDLPLRLNLTDARRGYSRAVREGMHMLEADYLLCIDSDGQCDAKDFWKFWGRSQKVRCSPRLARGPRPPGPVQGRFGTNSKQSGYVAEGDAGHLGPLIHLRNAGDGGSINYFFEGLFGLAPVAAFAVLRGIAKITSQIRSNRVVPSREYLAWGEAE